MKISKKREKFYGRIEQERGRTQKIKEKLIKEANVNLKWRPKIAKVNVK